MIIIPQHPPMAPISRRIKDKELTIPMWPLISLCFYLPSTPHWCPCSSLNMTIMCPPQGFCTGCSLCLELSSPRSPHSSLPHLLYGFAQISPSQRGPP